MASSAQSQRADSLTSLLSQNSELQTEIRRLSAEKDDLQRRFEISLEQIRDLSDRLAAAQTERQAHITAQISELKSRLEEERKVHQSEIAHLNDHLRDDQIELEKSEKAVKLFQLQLDTVFERASVHFGRDIRNVEELIPQLSDPVPVPTPVVASVCPKRKRAKIVRERIVVNDGLEQAKIQFKEQIDEMGLQLQEQENQNARLRQEIGEVRQANAGLNQLVGQLKGELECASIQSKSADVNEMITLTEKLKAVTQELNDCARQRDSLKKQLRPLLMNVQALGSQNQGQSAAVSRLEAENEQLRMQVQELKSLVMELESARQNSEARLAQLTTKTNDFESVSRELQTVNASKEAENRHLHDQIEYLQKAADEDRNALQIAEQQRESVSAILKETQAQLSAAESRLAEVMTQRDEFEARIKTLQHDLLAAKEPADVGDLLSIAPFSVDGFPEDLAAMIREIAVNPSLGSPFKLRQIFSLTERYYAAKNERLATEVSEFRDRESQNLTERMHFVTILRRLFPRIPIDENLLSDATQQEGLVQQIEFLKKESDNSAKACLDAETSLMELLAVLSSDSIEAAKSTVTRMYGRIQSLKNKVSESQRERDRLVQELRDLHSEMQSEAESLERASASFREELSVIERRHSDEMRGKDEVIAELEREMARQRDETIRLESEVKTMEQSLSQSYLEIREQKRLCAEAQREKCDLTDELSKTSRTVDLLLLRKKQLKSRLAEMQFKQPSSAKEHDRDASFELAEKRLTQQITVLSEGLDDSKAAVIRLTQELENAANRNNELRLSVDDLGLRLQKSELAYQRLQRTHEREKQLMEGNLKHQTILAENQLRSTIAELSYRIGESQKEVIGAVALQFAAFFDTENEIDESRFQSVLSEIRCKLLSCISTESKIRNLLRIGPTQSIEAAIAQLLLR
jgi:chromosome segregation ATPase